MTILEIVLLIIGLAAVMLSFKIGDKKDNNEGKKLMKIQKITAGR